MAMYKYLQKLWKKPKEHFGSEHETDLEIGIPELSGTVLKATVDAVEKGVDYAFDRLGFDGERPNIHIVESWIATEVKNDGYPYSLYCMGFLNEGEIYISYRRIAQITAQPDSTLSCEQEVSLTSAHEATHYVQLMNNISLDEISNPNLENFNEIHKHFLEIQADLVGSSAVRDIYDLKYQYVIRNEFINLSEENIDLLDELIDISIQEPSKLKDHYHFENDDSFVFYREPLPILIPVRAN